MNELLEANLKNNISLRNFFIQNAQNIGRLNAFHQHLFSSKLVTNVRDFLALTADKKLELASGLLNTMPEVEKFEPKRVGIKDKKKITGEEFLHYYSQSLEAEKNISLIYALLFRLNNPEDLDKPVGSHCQEAIKHGAFRSATFTLDDVLKAIEKLSINLPFEFSDLNKKFAKELVDKFSIGNESTNSDSSNIKESIVVSLEEADRLKATLRGCRAQDCATKKSYAQALIPTEHTFWVNGQEAYAQTSIVMSGSERALFIHTISGPRLKKDDVLNVLSAFYQMKRELGVSKIILPPKDRLRAFLNYAEVQSGYQEAIENGQRVPINYLDAPLRKEMSKYADNEIDIPERNTEGIVFVPKNQSISDLKMRVTRKNVGYESRYKETSSQEALLIALGIGSFSKTVPNQFFSEYGVNQENYKEMLRILSNPQEEPVAIFQQKARDLFAQNGLKDNFDDIKTTQILFRGHMVAPDAVSEENVHLAMKYIEPLLSSYEKSNYIYKLLKPTIDVLSKNPRFGRVVRMLFREDYNKIGAPSTHLEITTKSPRRVLMNLFEIGMSKEIFASELGRLEELAITNKGLTEADTTAFIRAATFMGSIYRSENKYSERLISHFENFFDNNIPVNYQDLKVMASYLEMVLENNLLTAEQIIRLNKMVLKTDLGLHLGFQTIRLTFGKLDDTKIIDKLFEKQRYMDAAMVLFSEHFAKQPSAERWLQKLNENRKHLEFDQMYRMFAENPAWIAVPGAKTVIAGLAADPNKTKLTEKFLAQIKAKTPVEAVNFSTKTMACKAFYAR